MSGDKPIAVEIGENLKAELAETPWTRHVQSMLISGGLLLFGVALGVKWAAVKTAANISCGTFTDRCARLSSVYNQQMLDALTVSVLMILAGLFIIQRTSGGDAGE